MEKEMNAAFKEEVEAKEDKDKEKGGGTRQRTV